MNNVPSLDVLLLRLFPFLLGVGRPLWIRQETDGFPLDEVENFVTNAKTLFAQGESIVFIGARFEFQFTLGGTIDRPIVTPVVLSHYDEVTVEVQSALSLIVGGSHTLPFTTERERYLWAYLSGLSRKTFVRDVASIIAMCKGDSSTLSVVMRQDDIPLTDNVTITFVDGEVSVSATSEYEAGNVVRDITYLLKL